MRSGSPMPPHFDEGKRYASNIPPIVTVVLVILALVVMLGGCATTGGGVRPQLPPLPAHLAAPCSDPGVRAGKPVLSEFARTRQAFAACSRKQRDGVRFYDGVRDGFRGR